MRRQGRVLGPISFIFTQFSGNRWPNNRLASLHVWENLDSPLQWWSDLWRFIKHCHGLYSNGRNETLPLLKRSKFSTFLLNISIPISLFRGKIIVYINKFEQLLNCKLTYFWKYSEKTVKCNFVSWGNGNFTIFNKLWQFTTYKLFKIVDNIIVPRNKDMRIKYLTKNY